jgi:hypothetical protein
MIVRKRKQLIQWDFLEGGHAQNLQKIVEREVHGHFFLNDRNERINRHGYPDLRPHRVLRRSIKRLDAKILLNPAEKQFNAPPEFMEFGDRQRRLKKVVGQKRKIAIILSIVKTDSPQRLGIIHFRFRTGQDDGLVGSQVHGFIEGSRLDPSRLKIRLGPDDEKHAVLLKGVEPGEVQIATIHDVKSSGFEGQLVEDPDIVRFPLRHMDKSGDRASQIEKGVEFDSPLAFAKLGPGKERQTQVDRRRIEGKDRFLELQTDVFVAVNSPGFGDEHLREIGIDPLIAGFVGVGQVASRDTATDAHMVKSLLHGQKASLDIAEAFPVGQLGESQAKELIETEEAFDFVVATVTPHAFSEFVHRQKGHDLGEDGWLGVHRSLLGEKKSTDYTKLRSNRLRTKSAVSSVFRA